METCFSSAGSYPLVSQVSRGGFSIGDSYIGGSLPFFCAGPCAIEDYAQLCEIGKLLANFGVSALRASAFKPRSSPYSFQGLGRKGLEIHKAAQKEHGLPIESEVMDPRDVAFAAEMLDIIRIGARNMYNYDLLKEVGKLDVPIILKRAFSATIDEWLSSAEYILKEGNAKVILCERGVRTFEPKTRATLDVSAIPLVKKLTGLPVIVDPSHAAGLADLVAPLSYAALAAGADGLLVEVHLDPKKSLCDARQALSVDEWKNLYRQAMEVSRAISRQSLAEC